MAIEIIVPTLGESVSDATVARWIKTTGDNVAADEPVVELETDKVTLEVPAPAAGQICDIVAAEGSVVEVGAILARLEEGVGGAPAKPAKNVAETPAEKPAQKSVGPVTEQDAPAVPAPAADGALLTAFNTSALVKRPPTPVPLILAGSRLCSVTRRRTAGDK